jgi:HSP20 family protein
MNDDKTTLLVRGDAGADLRNFDRLFETLFGQRRACEPNGLAWAPAVDVRETDAELVLYAALPGLNKEDIALEVQDNTLVLSGKMKPLGSEEDTWVRRELPRGDFHRAFHLSADVQVGKVQATMKNGVLEIRLPKAEEAKPRRVAIG